MIKIMEMENCVTTKTFLNEKLLSPTLKMPFSTFTGLKEDRKIAGYMPDKVPTIKGTKSRERIICHFDKITSERDWLEILFTPGNAIHVEMKARAAAIQQMRIDSLKN